MNTLLRSLCLLLPGLLSLPVAAGDFCFGGAGQQCGQFRDGALQGIAFCIAAPGNPVGICQVNGGSMTHDPCCVARPGGVMCGGSPFDDDQSQCKSEWDRAVHRTVFGYNWARAVNFNVENRSGNVVRADYCARPDAGVHRNDRGFCCSGSARRAGFWDRFGRPDLYRCNS